MKKRKATRRRMSSVSGIKMQPVKGLLNLPTLGTAGAVAYGAGEMVKGATEDEYAMLRSKQGATQLAIGGLVGALFIPGTGLFSKIGRGASLGAMLHGVKVLATGKDWAGNDVTIEKTADVVAGLWYTGQNPAGQFNNGGVSGGVRYGR